MSSQKVVLITDISSMFGEARAREFAKLGYKVAIIGWDQRKLLDVVETMVNTAPAVRRDDYLVLRM